MTSVVWRSFPGCWSWIHERYGDYAVMGEGALKRVNFLAFTDYWKWKKLLADKNGKKHVPEYNPREIARELGFYGNEILK